MLGREAVTELWQEFRLHSGQMSVFVFTIITLYGLSSYVSMFSVFVELPIFVNFLPERWTLPTHIILFMQLSSLAPAAYLVIKKYCKGKMKEWTTSIVLLALSIVSCPLLAIFWKSTVEIFSNKYSLALYILSVMIAVIDSTSQVVFLPYFTPYRPHFVTALYFGKSIGGIFTGLLGILQGSAKNPYCANATYYAYFNHRMVTELTEVFPNPPVSVSAFYSIMEFILILSLLAFLLLHFHPQGIKFQIAKRKTHTDTSQTRSSSSSESSEDQKLLEEDKKHSSSQSETMEKLKDISAGEILEEKESEEEREEEPDIERTQEEKMSPEIETAENVEEDWKSVSLDASSTSSKLSGQSDSNWDTFSTYINVIIFVSCFFAFGLTPSLLPYTSLPYSQTTLTLSITLSVIVTPIVCLVAILQTTKTTRKITILFFVALASAIYQLVIAFYSPSPPLKHSWFGSFLAVISYVLMDSLFNYVLLSCSMRISDEYGPRALVWSSTMTQIGCLAGSLTALLLTDVLQVLISKRLCDDLAFKFQKMKHIIKIKRLEV